MSLATDDKATRPVSLLKKAASVDQLITTAEQSSSDDEEDGPKHSGAGGK